MRGQKLVWNPGQGPQAPVQTKIAWKPGAAEQHRLDVERLNTLPRFVPIIDLTPETSKMLLRGLGLAYLTTTPLRISDILRRSAPILQEAKRITKASKKASFHAGQIALYAGPERSAENHNGTEVSVIRHVFIIANRRWVIENVNALVPL